MSNAQTLASFLTGTGNTSITTSLISTRDNNIADGGGQIYLNGTTGNRIDFNQNGVGAPTFTTRSTGTKIVLYPNISGSLVDFAFGIAGATLWSSVPSTTNFFKWYGGTTLSATLSGAGFLTTASGISSASPTAGIGYSTGAGGTVTQATSKTTGVTLNTICGTITCNAASLPASTTNSFTLTNSTIAATDNIITQIAGAFSGYQVTAHAIAAGSVVIDLRNVTAGALAEAVTIRFTVLKSVNA